MSYGTAVEYKYYASNNQVSFDPNNAGKFVVIYRDEQNSNYGTSIVGTVSGTSVSFGTEVIFAETGAAYLTYHFDFDPNNSGKFNIIYEDYSSSRAGTIIRGTVSGTSISYGSKTLFNTSNVNLFGKVAFDPNNANKFIIIHDGSAAEDGAAVIGNINTAMTAGTDYYVQADGTISTTSTSPAVKLGKALSTTSINLEFNT